MPTTKPKTKVPHPHPKGLTIPKASVSKYDLTKYASLKPLSIEEGEVSSLDKAIAQMSKKYEEYKLNNLGKVGHDLWNEWKTVPLYISNTKASNAPISPDTSDSSAPGGPSFARNHLAGLSGWPEVRTRRHSQGYWNSYLDKTIPVVTQKAKGIEALAKGTIRLPFGLAAPRVKAILPRDAWKYNHRPNSEDWTGLPPYIRNQLNERWPWKDGESQDTILFARPCPETPRHGFVESRPVTSDEDIFNLWTETKSHDPRGEIVLMPVLTGKYSGVAHNAGVAYGLGNDGVTGGDGAKFVPVPSTPEAVMRNVFHSTLIGANFHYYGVDHGIKTAPYLELVEHHGEIMAVQLRDGPVQSATVDFVPRAEVVTKLLSVPMVQARKHSTKMVPDLLAWETLVVDEVKANNGPQGLCLNLMGASLAAHAAVHAIQAGVSVVTSREVVLGEALTLVPGPAPLTDADYARLRDFLAHYAKPRTEAPERHFSAMTAAGVVHTSSLWPNDDHLLALRALGVTELIRLFTAAGAGEDRHWWDSGPGRDYSYTVDKPLQNAQAAPLGALCIKYLPKFSHKHDSIGRDKVYNAAFALPWEALYDFNLRIRRDFHTSGWKVRSSFGGLKWGKVAHASLKMLEAVSDFAEAPNEASWSRVMMEANKALALAHNSGKLLTKWVESETLDQIASCPLVGFLNPCAAECVLFAKASHNASYAILLPPARIKSNESQQTETETLGPQWAWSPVTDADVLTDDRARGVYWEEQHDDDEPIEQRESESDIPVERPDLRRDAKEYAAAKLQARVRALKRANAKHKRNSNKDGTGPASPGFNDDIPF